MMLLGGTAGALAAEPAFQATFESPQYSVGDVYDSQSRESSTLYVDTGGTSSAALSEISAEDDSAWTATVETNMENGQQLVIAQGAATGKLGGGLKFMIPSPETAGEPGWWYVEMDYTRLSKQAGVIGAMRPINQNGMNLIAHPNNVVLRTTSFEDAGLNVGETHKLRIEVEMGGNRVKTYIDGVLQNEHDDSNPNWDIVNDTGGAVFGGLFLDFGISPDSFTTGPLFAIDNVQMGKVEPSGGSSP